MERRKFLSKLSVLYSAAMLTSLFGCEHQEEVDQTLRGVSLGAVTTFAQGVTELAMYRVAVIRYGSELRVVSLVCPHQSCIVKPLVGGGYQCPCHGSEFNEDGSPETGPAQQPLSWIRAEISQSSEVIIYPKQKVRADFSVRL
jgi:Rieske Fe-S protein